MLHVPYGSAKMVYLCKDTLLSRSVLKMGFKRVENVRYLKVRHLEIINMYMCKVCRSEHFIYRYHLGAL
jgi:hypothetical protein